MKQEYDGISQRKRMLRKFIYIFLGMILILTFFSKTIYNLSIPTVKVQDIYGGTVVHEYHFKGQMRPKEIREVYIEDGWILSELLIKRGAKVEQGQQIATLENKTEDLNIEQEELELQKDQLALEELRNQTLVSGRDSYQQMIQKAKLQMETNQQKMERARMLYEAGSETKEAYEQTQVQYLDAKLEYEQTVKEQKEKEIEIVNQEKQKQNEIAILQYDIEIKKLQIQKLKEQYHRVKEIIAPCSGIVQTINLNEGQRSNSQEPIAEILHEEEGFEFVTEVPIEQMRYLQINQEVKIKLLDEETKFYTGQVERILPSKEENKPSKEVHVSIENKEVYGGEPGELQIRDESPYYAMTLPIQAVGEDQRGEFVYVIREREGALGTNTYISKEYVTVADHDQLNCAITKGIDEEERVVIEQSEPVFDGNPVRIKE